MTAKSGTMRIKLTQTAFLESDTKFSVYTLWLIKDWGSRRWPKWSSSGRKFWRSNFGRLTCNMDFRINHTTWYGFWTCTWCPAPGNTLIFTPRLAHISLASDFRPVLLKSDDCPHKMVRGIVRRWSWSARGVVGYLKVKLLITENALKPL